MPLNKLHTRILIVRLWPERSGPGQVVWRGSVDDVQTGERFYFQTVADLAARIAAMLGTVSFQVERKEKGEET